MKKILCFGDSNTFGFNPENSARYEKNVRWTGVLQKLLADNYKIIEAGCNNRTCAVEQPDGRIFTSYKILPEILTHDFEIIILAVGINDLQRRFSASTEEIATGLDNLIKLSKKKCPNAKIIALSPAKLTEHLFFGNFASFFERNAIEKSIQLTKNFEQVAKINNCAFIDLNKIVETSPIDGLHHSAEQHFLIAQTIYKEILTFK